MIVAVATENNMVAQHFGRCPEYTIYGIDDGRIVEQNVIANPGHEPGFLPRYLADTSPEEEKAFLNEQKEQLKEELSELEQRMAELEES